MPKKKPLKGEPEVNEAIKGFDIRINEFGEIVSNFEIERIKEFLDERIEDKKLPEKDRKDASSHTPGKEDAS